MEAFKTYALHSYKYVLTELVDRYGFYALPSYIHTSHSLNECCAKKKNI